MSVLPPEVHLQVGLCSGQHSESCSSQRQHAEFQVGDDELFPIKHKKTKRPL